MSLRAKEWGEEAWHKVLRNSTYPEISDLATAIPLLFNNSDRPWTPEAREMYAAVMRELGRRQNRIEQWVEGNEDEHE